LKATPYLPPLCAPHHDKHCSRTTALYGLAYARMLGIPARDTINYREVSYARAAGKHKATGLQSGGRLHANENVGFQASDLQGGERLWGAVFLGGSRTITWGHPKVDFREGPQYISFQAVWIQN
jgi:hypothetical protein